jgi:hypothetical protein
MCSLGFSSNRRQSDSVHAYQMESYYFNRSQTLFIPILQSGWAVKLMHARFSLGKMVSIVVAAKVTLRR